MEKKSDKILHQCFGNANDGPFINILINKWSLMKFLLLPY
jgi:hypothetical protein